MSHLQYEDDLIILIARGIEDLRIIKLILYLFKSISGLVINFQKTCFYSTKIGHYLHSASVNLMIRGDVIF